MSKSIASRNGKKVFLRDYVPRKNLEVGVYRIVDETLSTPMHLEDFTDFVLPEKIYGEQLDYITNKTIKAFHTLGKSVGVLLSGLKGTGKSLQLKHIALNSDMPVLIVDVPISGNNLIGFLEKVPTSCVIVFDEFEKVYNSCEYQNSILPMLDGLSSTPHIYVLTVNGQVSEFLMDRPSRIRYAKEYTGLSVDLIKSVAEDLLEDKSKVEEVMNFICILDDVNMDTLVSFIQDVNMFPEENAVQIARTFNVENPMTTRFNITVETDGLLIYSPDKKFDEKIEYVAEYMEKEFGYYELRLNMQISDMDILRKNREIMESVVAKFPSFARIGPVTARIESYNFEETIEKMTNDEVYMTKDYGSQSVDIVAYSDITNTYLHCPEGVDIKRSASNTFDLFTMGRKFASAKKPYKASKAIF